MTRIKQHIPFVALVAIYVAVAAWLSFRLPAFTTPNEVLHYEYVALLRQTGTLPDPSTSRRMDERHQPPLYYGLAALLSLPFPQVPLDTNLEPNPYMFGTPGGGNRNPFINTGPGDLPVLYAGRLISVLFGILALAATYYATSRTVSRALALLVVSLIAFQPMFLFLSASLSNDLAGTAMSALLLAYTTLMIVDDRRTAAYAGWGILFGLAMLTKASSIFLAITLVVALFAKWRTSGRFRSVIRPGMAAGLGFIPIYAAWLIFNQVRGLDAMGTSRSLPMGMVLRVNPLEWFMVKPHLLILWKSFWLDWSTGETGYVVEWTYLLWAIALLLALAGWTRRRADLKINGYLPWMNLLWGLPLVAMFMSVKVLMIRDHDLLVPEGRWLLPILPSLAWLVAIGFARWWPAGDRSRAAFVAAVVPLLSTSILLINFIPAQYPAALQLSSLEKIPTTAEITGLVFDEKIALVAMEAGEIVTGEAARVDVYWLALQDIEANYTVESRLVLNGPDSWEPQVKIKSYPGFGLNPTAGWRQGDVYQDGIVVKSDVEPGGPVTALIEIRLLEGQEPLSISQNKQELETGIGSRVIVRPAGQALPPEEALLAEPVIYGEKIELIAIKTNEEEDGLALTLWWRSLEETTADYTVFVHGIDKNGNLLAQNDGMPVAGLSPTGIWRQGDVIRDRRWLSMEPAAGRVLLIGIYDLATLVRLPAVQDGKPLASEAHRIELP